MLDRSLLESHHRTQASKREMLPNLACISSLKVAGKLHASEREANAIRAPGATSAPMRHTGISRQPQTSPRPSCRREGQLATLQRLGRSHPQTLHRPEVRWRGETAKSISSFAAMGVGIASRPPKRNGPIGCSTARVGLHDKDCTAAANHAVMAIKGSTQQHDCHGRSHTIL